ncbi:MAG: hypothetical protein VX899_15695 [Myxococcota bacterium]|nr:hypothetical protein [Myxococcota bacterium]
MARSLTVKHTEKPGTSSLFNAFLILAAAWLGLSLLASAFVSEADAAPEASALINAE